MSPRLAALQLGGALLLGVLVPWLVMRLLVPSLESGRRVENYRGRPVFAGLGIVWLVWGACAILAGTLSGLQEASLVAVLALAGPLALVAFALGLVDDAYGTSADRGFRGHLRALRRGRLTTGGMKLFGISLASYIAALVVLQATPWPVVGTDAGQLAAALPAGAAIALTANFLNLTDLRPGRALKAYLVLAALGLVATIVLVAPSFESAEGVALGGAVLSLFLAGPVVAVWRYDLGERGMLGDAGANAMGAVAGLFVVLGLPWWGVLAYAAAMLALNVTSERVSFSAVIERHPMLRALDRLGRLPVNEDGGAGPSIK